MEQIIISVLLAIGIIALEFYQSNKKTKMIKKLAKENKALINHLNNYKEFISEKGTDKPLF